MAVCFKWEVCSRSTCPSSASTYQENYESVDKFHIHVNEKLGEQGDRVLDCPPVIFHDHQTPIFCCCVAW